MMRQRLLSRAHPVARRLSSEGPSGRTKRIMMRAEASVDTVSEKQRLLSLIDGTSRGLTTSDEVAQSIEQQCQLLEGMNPTEKPLASPLVSGKWELVYTTSNSILGKGRGLLRPGGPIYQTIDAENLKAKNNETWPLFNQVKADLTALSDSKVAVQFTFFKLLGLLPIPAPADAKGELDVTFLDQEMRISRGDKGNLFVLLMRDRDARP